MGENKTLEVVNALSELILNDLKGAADEQYSPRWDPDSTDDEIKFRKERAQKLRVMRAEFEVIMTGVL